MSSLFPDATLRSHLAILGKTGSGKTSTAKLLVEQVVAKGARVCVLDPIKSDWWGLTSSADGKKAGLPFHILGGPHGHVPLHSSAGAAIGELVANASLPLSIIDMADFEPGGLQHFFNDFAPVLLRKMKGVLYLVIEEAHEFAPKERSGIGNENMSVHYAKSLATAGRSKGIRLIVATQRTQALHNAVLGSCETLITHRLIAPADQQPVIGWLKANAEKEQADKVARSLSSLKTGTGWICSGEAGIFEQVAFPRIATYDNTATPTGDLTERKLKTAAVDLDRLRGFIGEAVAQAEANDPKKLKEKIVELEKKLAIISAPSNEGSKMIALEQLAEAKDQGFAEGYSKGFEVGVNTTVAEAGRHIAALRGEILAEAAAGGVQIAAPEAASVQPTSMKQVAAAQPKPKATKAVLAKHDGLTNPQRDLLLALAWWRAMGHKQPTRTQVAAIAGWKPKGSNLRNRLTELSSAGLVTYPSSGLVALTQAGLAAAPRPDVGRTLVESIRAMLTNPQLAIFDELYRRPGQPRERADLAAAMGWEPAGSNLRNRLTELSALELISYPARGTVQLQSWVTA